jgi:hypothetical protein
LYLSSMSYLLNLNHFNQLQKYLEEFVLLTEKIEDEIDIFNVDQLIKHENKFNILSCFKSDLHYTLTQINIILEKLTLLKVQIEGIEVEIEQPKIKTKLNMLDNKLTHISNLTADIIRNVETLNRINIAMLIAPLPENMEPALNDIEVRLDKITEIAKSLNQLQISKSQLLNTITNK